MDFKKNLKLLPRKRIFDLMEQIPSHPLSMIIAPMGYLDVFRDRTLERTRNGPKLVYICAPLRGDVEQNITFAKEKAREVFQAGDIPICPHLMFPPFADPDDPVQDQAAREMGLRLVEHCQQVNVYGPVRTPGMLAEIRRAEELRIPVKADQPGLQKTKGRPRRGQSR